MEPLHILTDRSQRRTTIICGVAYGKDVDKARDVIEEAVKSCPGVRSNRIPTAEQGQGLDFPEN